MNNFLTRVDRYLLSTLVALFPLRTLAEPACSEAFTPFPQLAELNRLSGMVSDSNSLVVTLNARGIRSGSDFNMFMSSGGFAKVEGGWETGQFTLTLTNPANRPKALRFFSRFKSEVTDLRLVHAPAEVVVYDLPRESWVAKTKGLSPGNEFSESLKDSMIAIWPRWAKSADPSFNGPEVVKTSDVSLVAVPKSQAKSIEEMMTRMGEAKSYQEGLVYLREYMQAVGLIESFKSLSLVHGTSVGPEIIGKSGLLSSQELKSRGLPHNAWGQNLGDGIYFVGAEGWGNNGTSTWGNHQYEVTLTNVNLFRGTNRFLAGFVKIYDLFREKWGLERYGDDSLLVPGLPQGVFSVDGLLARLPWIYQDLQVQGTSSILEILIKARQIGPEHITNLPVKDKLY